MSFHGVGGLTVPRLARELRLLFSHQPPPRVIILEIGTNDLSSCSPEVVIGDLFDLVELLQSVDSSTVVSVCKVVPVVHLNINATNVTKTIQAVSVIFVAQDPSLLVKPSLELPTPVRINRLAPLLSGYSTLAAEYLITCFCFGFPTPFLGPSS